MPERTEHGQSEWAGGGWLPRGRSPLLPFPSPWRSKASCQASQIYERTGFHLRRGIPKVRDGVPHLVLWLEPFQGTQGPQLAMASSGHTAGAQGGRQGFGGCKNPATVRGVGRPRRKAVKVTRWELPWTGEAGSTTDQANPAVCPTAFPYCASAS